MIKISGKYCEDCLIMIDEVEDEAMKLIYEILNNPAFDGSKVRIMADVHAGKGIVIGFTAPISDQINPSHVGVDIGCSITTCITDKEINKDDFAILEHRIKNAIPMGHNVHDKSIVNEKDFFKFLRKEYSKARSSWPDMILDETIDENYINKLLSRIGMDKGLFYKSIGTIGGGNHFIEVGDFEGKYAFTVHCGSRNFGVKVCKYWEKISKSNKVDKNRLRERINEIKRTTKDKTVLPQLIKEVTEEEKLKATANGYLSGDNMRGYLSDMVIAQAYAKYNHIVICGLIEDIFKKTVKSKVVETIQSIHNYVDIIGDHIIRKGAIRAYKDEKMIVPFNMRDGIAICIGKSNEEWNCSCSHGAGRILSRSKAKSTLSMEEFKETMKNVSLNFIYFN